MRRTPLYILGFFSGIFSLAEAQDFSPPKSILTSNLGFQLNPNQNPRAEEFIPRIGLFYLNNDDLLTDSTLFFVFGGPFLAMGLDTRVNKNWFFTSEINTLLFFAGDSPKIDGSDFDDAFQFRGHRFGGRLGWGYEWRQGRARYKAALRYASFGHSFFKEPRAAGYILSSNFFEHGPDFEIGAAGGPRSELYFFGVRPLLKIGFRNRVSYEPWGLIAGSPSARTENSKNSLYAGVQLDTAIPLRPKFVLLAKTDALWMSSADRLNAASNGELSYTDRSLFLSQVKSDRSLKSQLGFRHYLNQRKTLAWSTLIFGAHYRELVIADKRNQVAFGGALKMMGAVGDRFDWNAVYGLVHGVDDSRNLVHEIGVHFNFRILPRVFKKPE